MTLATRRKVLGAFHVALFPDWKSISQSVCRRLQASGLLARTSKVLVGIVGDRSEDVSSLVDMLGPRAEIRRFGPLSLYEFPTLEWLYDEAEEDDYACWYMHTKGVSSMSDDASEHRLAMEAVVADNHSECLSLLETYDACGTDWWTTRFGLDKPHFAGNFWWANSVHLRSLPPPSTLDVRDRYQAEFWVGGTPGMRVFNFPHQGDPFERPSAWKGLEVRFKELLGDMGPVRRVIDLGVDYGFSTFQFATHYPDAEVIGIDDFTLHGDSEAWVRCHLNMFPNVRILKGSSAAIGRSFREPVDLLHVDADHSYESVTEDFCSWLHAVRPGGRVLFHDTTSFPSVRRFFDGLGGNKSEITEHHGLGCWVKS